MFSTPTFFSRATTELSVLIVQEYDHISPRVKFTVGRILMNVKGHDNVCGNCIQFVCVCGLLLLHHALYTCTHEFLVHSRWEMISSSSFAVNSTKRVTQFWRWYC